MKYRTPILNKSIVKRKTGSGENENRYINGIKNINSYINSKDL